MSARLQGVAAAPGVARAAPWTFRPPVTAGAILLIGLGVDELSMGAGSIGGVKRAVAGRTRDEMVAIARQALTVRSAAEVRALLGAP